MACPKYFEWSTVQEIGFGYTKYEQDTMFSNKGSRKNNNWE
jgi:hypothetical protein